MHFVDGKALFMLARTCTAVAGRRRTTWSCGRPRPRPRRRRTPSIFRSAKEAKQLYRAMASDWASIAPRHSAGWRGWVYPQDISGTKNGIPLRLRVLATLKIAIRLTSRRLLSAEKLRELSDAALVCLFSLMQSSCHNMQELALALAANLMHKNEYGPVGNPATNGALHFIRDQTKSHCLGSEEASVTTACQCPRRAPAPRPRRMLRARHCFSHTGVSTRTLS